MLAPHTERFCNGFLYKLRLAQAFAGIANPDVIKHCGDSRASLAGRHQRGVTFLFKESLVDLGSPDEVGKGVPFLLREEVCLTHGVNDFMVNSLDNTTNDLLIRDVRVVDLVANVNGNRFL